MKISPKEVVTQEVKNWQGLHLLHFQGSSCSQKVRLILGELELKWVSHPINLIRHENATAWFLGINPRGVVPVLIHDGDAHVESNDILRYLDRRYAPSGRGYFFDDSEPKATEAQQLLDAEDSLHGDLRLLTIRFGPLTIKNQNQIDAQQNNGSYNEKRKLEVEWWRDISENGIREADIVGAVARFRDTFTQLDKRLAQQQWLMDDRMSIVDISWFVNIQRLVRLGYPLSRHRNLFLFYGRLAARPSFKADSRHLGSRIGSLVFTLKRLENRLKNSGISKYLDR